MKVGEFIEINTLPEYPWVFPNKMHLIFLFLTVRLIYLSFVWMQIISYKSINNSALYHFFVINFVGVNLL